MIDSLGACFAESIDSMGLHGTKPHNAFCIWASCSTETGHFRFRSFSDLTVRFWRRLVWQVDQTLFASLPLTGDDEREAIMHELKALRGKVSVLREELNHERPRD